MYKVQNWKDMNSWLKFFVFFLPICTVVMLGLDIRVIGLLTLGLSAWYSFRRKTIKPLLWWFGLMVVLPIIFMIGLVTGWFGSFCLNAC